MKIYVASSWRNETQPEVVKALRDAGHEVYDFKNPREGDRGFHWSEIDPEWKTWTPAQYVMALEHPIACAGFKSDFDAMKWADACVMVMPCGRSAHLEAGYFVGAGKPLIILASQAEPELMYKMANYVCIDIQWVVMLLKELDYKNGWHQWHSCSTTIPKKDTGLVVLSKERKKSFAVYSDGKYFLVPQKTELKEAPMYWTILVTPIIPQDNK